MKKYSNFSISKRIKTQFVVVHIDMNEGWSSDVTDMGRWRDIINKFHDLPNRNLQ